MKIRRVGVVDGVAVRLPHAHALATLPVEVVEEILLRVPPDEPARLVHATVVCKAWHRIISDDGFLHCYRRFHGTPPLLGFIGSYRDSIIRFFPTTSVATSPLGTPALINRSNRKPSALDCRHGRVLITGQVHMVGFVDRLIVWDPVTGGQHQLNLPTYLQSYIHAGAVLCAKDGCDHLDCHGGPFRVVLLKTRLENNDTWPSVWASVYSSETGAWSAWTPNGIANQYIYNSKPSLFTGDAVYFITAFHGTCNIVKYDLSKHELSLIHTPAGLGRHCSPILVKGDGGGLGVAAMLHNCIYMWSWKVSIEGVGEWVKRKVLELDDTLLPRGGRPPHLSRVAEGTDTAFVSIDHKGIFMVDLKSKQVNKIRIGKTLHGLILPYTSYYSPKY